MEYEETCVNNTKGFDVDTVTKRAIPREYGLYVFTPEECHKLMKYRRDHNVTNVISICEEILK